MQPNMKVPTMSAPIDRTPEPSARDRVLRLFRADWRSRLLPIAMGAATIVVAACKGGGSSGY
jgi:hypothetical protein